jgi:hypothetical protein
MVKNAKHVTTAVLAMMAMVLAACSDDDDGGGERGAAAAQCDALVSKICDKLAPCESVSKSECVSQANQAFAEQYGDTCDGADQVGATYDQCMGDMDGYTCGGSLPATCNGVILYK